MNFIPNQEEIKSGIEYFEKLIDDCKEYNADFEMLKMNIIALIAIKQMLIQ